MATGKCKTAEPRLSAADWESAALDALAAQGLAGVAIEPLARRLGVTKGSFYWHFADREALLRAALTRWERTHTERIIEGLAALPDARARLSRLVGGVPEGARAERVHLALAAASHPLVREALARVAQRRLAYLESCYRELGQARRQARHSALVAYAAYLGLVHLGVEAPGELPKGAGGLSAFTADLVARLVP